MYRRHGNKLRWIFMGCDLGVTGAVWCGAYALRFSLFPSPNGVPDFELVLGALPLVLLVAALAYQMAGLYEIHRLRQLPREIGVICKATGLLFLLAITVAFYRRDLYESRLALGMFPVLNVVMLTLSRRVIWRAVKWARGKGLNHGRAVIVGIGRTGRLVEQTIQNNRWTGLEMVGFVDDARHVPKGFQSGTHLGPIDELESIVNEHDVDHVFVALSLDRYGELNQVTRALERVLVEVQIVPDIPNLAGMKLRMTEIDNLGFLSLRENPHAGWARFAKRATDLVLGSAALIVLSPVMLGLAVAVKLTSPGPIFYRQTRNGLGRKPFSMLKFRTMRHDAETLSGPVWAVRGDQRCTPLG
ncbi:MAG: sugar transferase, partial [Planctomycetia bacterium]